MKQGLLLLGCLVAAAGCKQAPPTQMETGYEVMTVSPTDRMISSAYSATIRAPAKCFCGTEIDSFQL